MSGRFRPRGKVIMTPSCHRFVTLWAEKRLYLSVEPCAKSPCESFLLPGEMLKGATGATEAGPLPRPFHAPASTSRNDGRRSGAIAHVTSDARIWALTSVATIIKILQTGFATRDVIASGDHDDLTHRRAIKGAARAARPVRRSSPASSASTIAKTVSAIETGERRVTAEE